MKRTSALVGMLVVGAVSMTAAQTEKKMDHAMNDMMQMTYAGCVESINHGAAFVLTHVSEDHMMSGHGGAMKNDAMMKMKDDANESAATKQGSMHAMAPAALLLTGAVNLRKHAGQEVRVTGVLSKAADHAMPQDLDTLRISSLKIVAKSCNTEAHNQ